MNSPRIRSSRPGFTLVELLTVMAIITILMGILLPVINSVMETAKKTQAKSDELQIVNAIKAYYAEYGKYPLATADTTYGTGSTTTSGTGLTGQAALMYILRNVQDPVNLVAGVNSTTASNSRAIPFLQVPDAKNLGQNGKERGGISGANGTSQGAWLDPWGNEYAIRIDGNYDNVLANPYALNAGNASLNLGVIVYSFGRDGATNFADKSLTTSKDDVISWQ